MWILFGCLALLLAVLVFYRFYPPFGGVLPKMWKGSKNFHGRAFVNQVATSMDMKARDIPPLLLEMIRRGRIRKPVKVITPERIDIAAMIADKKPQVVWFGHSTTLLRIGGKTIMTDPVLSNRASPFPFAGPKRTISKRAISAEELPQLDAVVISHNHYDHLDFSTIKALRSKTAKFFVPLGVATHLRTWGVPSEKIVELDWWDEARFEGIVFACTPARHFSGRTLTDRDKTLWSSWVIRAKDTSVFFSGDSGYGPHFKQIGKKYGPFDLTLLECGQYDRRWGTIHMMPEQTLTAHQDLKGKRLVPVHWGAFVLSLHTWTDPVERVKKAAQLAKVELVTPRLGEVVSIKSSHYPTAAWWKEYQTQDSIES